MRNTYPSYVACLRAALDLTQNECALECGIVQSIISLIENDDPRISFDEYSMYRNYLIGKFEQFSSEECASRYLLANALYLTHCPTTGDKTSLIADMQSELSIIIRRTLEDKK